MNAGIKAAQRFTFRRGPSPTFLFRASFSNQRSRFSAMASTTDLKTYKFNHSMIRVKDPVRSIEFYKFMGLDVIRKLQFPESNFDLYFLANDGPGAAHQGKSVSDREAILELTHNYGTENDPDFKVNNGNEEPHRGFGHIAFTVDNMRAVCKRLEDAGYTFLKKYDADPIKGFAFVLDPDGYFVELCPVKPVAETEGETETDVASYRLHHTMIRVKDFQKSKEWYERVLGMKHVLRLPMPENQHPIPFMGMEMNFFTYVEGKNLDLENILPGLMFAPGVLEMGWTPGDETNPDIQYHNGNTEPQGFGHICISVDNLDAACKRFDELNVTWKKRLTDGRMRNIAFILDPDGYWVEIVQNDKHSSKYSVSAS